MKILVISNKELRDGVRPPWWYREIGRDYAMSATEYLPLGASLLVRIYRRIRWWLGISTSVVTCYFQDKRAAYNKGYWKGRTWNDSRGYVTVDSKNPSEKES